jgi:hypothetical protein
MSILFASESFKEYHNIFPFLNSKEIMDSQTSLKDAIIQVMKKLYGILQLSKIFEVVLLTIWKLFFNSKPIFTM